MDENENRQGSDQESSQGENHESPQGDDQENPQGSGNGNPQSGDSLQGIHQLIEKLNESGIPFTRDVWIDENGEMGKEEYGVVEITGSPLEIWGDDRMVYQRISGNVILYVMAGADEKTAMVQDILKGMDNLVFSLSGCQVITDMAANRWTWRFTMESYL